VNEENPFLYKVLKEFKKLTSCSVLVNTSFNVRGEPIVCTAEDAYNCFMRTGIDYALIGGELFDKTEQPAAKSEKWAFKPD
jgi:carbamoyltransferase